MMTQTKQPKYEWQNKLSFDDRQLLIRHYLQGYGLYHIAISFGVTPSTVEYHLKKAQVYIPNKKPTLFGNVNPIRREAPIVKRTLTKHVHKDNASFYFDEFGERYKQPLSYLQIVRKQQGLERLRQAQRRMLTEQENNEPKGFLVRVSLTTGNTIIRKDGQYEFIQGGTGPEVYTSTSTYSW